MKKFIILSGLVSSLHILYAQSNQVTSSGNIKTTSQLFIALKDSADFDSLKTRAAQATDSETRALTLFAITAEYLHNDLDSSLKYIRQFNEIPNKSKTLEGNGYTIMGDLYVLLGNASLALENLLKATKILQELNDPAGMGMAYWNLGKLYHSIGDTLKAITYYSSSIKIAAAANEKMPWSYSMGHLGRLYMELNRPDSALYYTQSAYEQRKQDRRNYEPILLAQLGNIYKKMDSTALAKQYFRRALNRAYLTYNIDAGSDACIGIANLFKEEKRYDSCYYYGKEALDLAHGLSMPSSVWKASKFLKEFFQERKLLDSAFRYQEIMIAANDSMHSLEKINKVHVISFAEQQRIEEAEVQKREFQNKIKQYILVSSLAVFLIVALLLYRNNRHKQKANTLLHAQKQEIQHTLTELKITQAQLIQSEKMASLGELTAGIAHEIQNPLNFVNNFSEVNRELVDELKAELAIGNMQSAIEIAENIKDNEQKINHHGKRAEAIVKGMLQHSRVSGGEKELTDINALCDEYLRLAFHGLRAKDKSFNAKIETNFDTSLPKMNVVPQDIGRVVLNLINNAFYACTELGRSTASLPSPENIGTGAGGFSDPKSNETPTVWLSTKKDGHKILISVKDNGSGIPGNILDKIFQPFFTTKPTGQGTGLGLSLAYDIVKAHGGEMKVETKEGEGTAFTIHIPAN